MTTAEHFQLVCVPPSSSTIIKAQEEKPYPHVLGDDLIASILKSIIGGDARLSGCATNHGTKRMYLEVSFYEDEVEQDV